MLDSVTDAGRDASKKAMKSNRTLIKNGLILSDVDAPLIRGGSVLIEDGMIRKVGRFSARADEEIDAEGQLVMPGLIQTHVHCCQTLLRGMAEDMPLLPWLREVVWPMEAAHDRASIRASAQLTCAELIRGGTTTAMTFETVRHTDAVLDVLHECGLAGVVSHCFMDERSGYPPLIESHDDALDYCDELAQVWQDHPRLRLALAPRFALSCSGDHMQEVAALARDCGLLIHTHASEQQEETAIVYEQTGMGNIEYLHHLGLSGPDVCLAHCVHPAEHETAILKATGTHVLHCPSANFKLGSGTAPVPEYLEQGISVSLGADGAPCNNRLDAFMEMRMAGLIQKPRKGQASLPAADILRMATEGGAKALGLGDDTGTLAAGKRADIIIVNMDSLSAVPSGDVMTNVVYSCSAGDVLLTMIGGQVVYEDGACTTLDEKKIVAEAKRHKKKCMQRAGLA